MHAARTFRFCVGLLSSALCCLSATTLAAPANGPLAGEEQRVREQADRVINDLSGQAGAFGGWVDRVASSIRDGSSVEPWIGPVSAARVVACLLVLLLASGLAWGLVRGIRRFAGKLRKHGDMSWPRMLLSAARKPLAFSFVLVAVFFSVGLLLDAAAPRLLRFLSGCVYVGLTVAAFWALFRIIRGVQRKLQALADRSDSLLDNLLVPVVGTALRLLAPLLCLVFVRGALRLPETIDWIAGKSLAIVFIGSIAYLIIRATNVAVQALMKINRLDVSNNLRAREIHTQASVIRKIVVVSTIFVAVGCTLMLFQPVRQVGTSLLASAGIAGVVLGFAAQKTLSNLFAGIQIAFSQPIRLDDVVVVENEWGRIEDITLTFVTVRIWDERRLVLPIHYFIEKPFQNWTRKSADVLNAVFLHVDFTLPIEPLRVELKRLLDASENWDRRGWGLQVTDMSAGSLEVRCVMTSRDAPRGWELKCEIREGLVKYIREKHPGCFPRTRAELRRDPAGNRERASNQ